MFGSAVAADAGWSGGGANGWVRGMGDEVHLMAGLDARGIKRRFLMLSYSACSACSGGNGVGSSDDM